MRGVATPFRILVVEDEPVIRELVRSLLSESDCQVEAAANGVEGLKLARTQSFDLILLDVVLPQMDGITVCRMLKADPATAKVPLHMLTAKAKKSDVEAAERAGADGYIHKPFRGAELLDLVTQLKAKRPGG
ncbi:MAG: response regulator [Myxococcales bacterium]|nr:response regulator [Myxococcales bacterium]